MLPQKLQNRLVIFYEECSLDYPDQRAAEVMDFYSKSDLFTALTLATDFLIVLDEDKLDVWEIWYKELENQFKNYYLGVCETLLFYKNRDLDEKERMAKRLYIAYNKKNKKK